MTDVAAAFIRAACVPRHGSHASGTLEEAAAILAKHPGTATHDIHTAAILGDDTTVRRILADNPAAATAPGGPYGWDPLTHLCFSRYLRLDPARSDGFVRAATALLDAGASANTGWQEPDHLPGPAWEPVLYGAAGIAHHPGLTRLLLERGADPTADEVVYHAPESDDNRALALLVETGKLRPVDLALMLIRKHDWHDLEGVRYLLDHGADPNQPWASGRTALHHALARGNGLETITLLVERGADPSVLFEGISAAGRAAREGRGDVLELFERRRIREDLSGLDWLLAACARNDPATMRLILQVQPGLAEEVRELGGTLLARFACNGNAGGVGQLIDLGVDAGAPYPEGDGYFGIPPGSLAIHVAAWRGWPAVVQVLIARGSPVDTADPNGRTPMMLAVRACVDSYWTDRRSPESVRALLAAGASARGIPAPTGYAAVDTLLA